MSPRTPGHLESWFLRRGSATIIVGRFIPGLRIPTTVTAGISGIPAASFLITAAIAAPLWSSMFYLLGAVLGRQGPLVTVISAGLLHAAPRWLLVLGALLILVGVGGLWELGRRRRLQHVEAWGAPAVTNMPARQWQSLASARERDESPATLRGTRLLVMPCCRARSDRRSRACRPGR